MRPCSQTGKRGVEIDIKTRIERQGATLQLQDVDFVVSVEVDLAETVLIQEVVCHDYTLLIVRQQEIMRRRARTKVHRRENRRVSPLLNM